MADVQTQGKIVQCIGAVVDVEFPRDKMPKVYDALKMERWRADARSPASSWATASCARSRWVRPTVCAAA